VTSGWTALVAITRASLVAVPIAVGLYAWRSRSAERFGRLLVAVGFTAFLTTLAESGDSVLYSIGRLSGWVLEVGLIWLMLAFPTGRLTTPIDRALVGFAAALVAVLYLPSGLLVESYPVPSPVTSCTAACPENAFVLAGAEPAVVDSLVLPLRDLLSVLLFVAVTARLSLRVRRASTLMRRTLAPVLTVAIARLVLLAIATAVRRAAGGAAAVEPLVWGIALAIPALAVAFLLGLVRRRLREADALRRFGLGLGGLRRPSELQDALAEAVEDPTLRVVYRVEGASPGWVDVEGRAVEAPAPGSGRCLTEVHDGDRLVAGVVHDDALSDDTEFVRAVASYALVVLENARLGATVEASLEEVLASRARLLASADRERRRIERDLHDGAQQRLVALRVQLELTEELIKTDPAGGRRKLHGLGEEVGATLDEIRLLARGVYPSLLADRGLGEALRAAALRLPVAATVRPDGLGRYSPDVESAVYFCCLEAMQNASKHARDARTVTIVLHHDDALSFEVRDDGAGFDIAATPPGAGLTNMRDRLAAVGGEVAVRSGPGRGTVVSGTVPVDGCA
jgi:signal transduction histidine kinase